MRDIAAAVLVSFCCLAASGATRADSTYTCGSKIIMIGSTQSDVLQHCGEPTSKINDNDAMREGKYYVGTSSIEHWKYTSGAVTTVVDFDQGVVTEIHTESAE